MRCATRNSCGLLVSALLAAGIAAALLLAGLALAVSRRRALKTQE